MLVQGIKSRPVYTGLDADHRAKRHLVVAEGEGAQAVRDLVTRAPATFTSRLSLLYVPAPAADHSSVLLALGADHFERFAAVPDLLVALDTLLVSARMGVRLYVTGTEPFIGLTVRLAQDHGINHLSIRTEHRGSLARRVYCVHCKGITEDARFNIVTCRHCQASLLVRDHYSRRLAAFMGVAADAEAPGQLPPIEESFP